MGGSDALRTVRAGRCNQECLDSALDPRIPPEAKARGITAHSKLIIEAVKPFAWSDRFPKLSALSHEDARAIAAKWGDALQNGVRG